jgi:hypothetical protein
MTPASSRLPAHPQPRGSTRPSREPGTHYPRAMPHVYHHDSTSGPGDARGTSHRQACRRCLLHASRQQGRSAAPPPGTATTKPHVAARTSAATVLELSCRPSLTVLVQTPADPLKLATAPQLVAAIVRSSPIVTLAAEATTTEAPTMGPIGGPVAEAIAAAEATRTATPPEPHRAASTPARRLKNCGGRSLPP